MKDTIWIAAAAVAVAILVFGLAKRWRGKATHRWRRRQALAMCDQLQGDDRDQPRGLIYARRRAMDALAFEELVIEAFEWRGNRVVRSRRYSGDGGVDGEVIIGGKRVLLQMKRYRRAIRPEHVRAFVDLCARRRARGLFIHAGRTGEASRAAVDASQHVDIVSGDRLIDLLTGRPCAGAKMPDRTRRPKRGSAYLLLLVIAISLAFFGGDGKAWAKSGSSLHEAKVSACIRKAAHGKLWLERTLWALRDQEGGWIGAAVANTNGTDDLGPLQVNSWWVPRIAGLVKRPETHVRYWLQNDACFNVEAARWIFLSGLAATGDYWKAIGVYHSPTAWRQARYAKAVAFHLRRRFGR